MSVAELHSCSIWNAVRSKLATRRICDAVRYEFYSHQIHDALRRELARSMEESVL